MERKVTLRRLSRWSLILFFTIAGTNHFITPESYYPLIPDYLREWDKLINVVSGRNRFCCPAASNTFQKSSRVGIDFSIGGVHTEPHSFYPKGQFNARTFYHNTNHCLDQTDFGSPVACPMGLVDCFYGRAF